MSIGNTAPIVLSPPFNSTQWDNIDYTISTQLYTRHICIHIYIYFLRVISTRDPIDLFRCFKGSLAFLNVARPSFWWRRYSWLVECRSFRAPNFLIKHPFVIRQAALSWPLCHYIGWVPMDRWTDGLTKAEGRGFCCENAKVLTLMESNWLVPTAMSAF